VAPYAPDTMPDIAYVNGRWSALEEAVISINDRGFLFGDGVYEVVRVYDGRMFRPDLHLARLARSASHIALDLPLTREDFLTLFEEALRRSGQREAIIYLQVTRGVAPRSHAIPPDLTPSVIVTVRPAPVVTDAVRAAGVAVVTVPDVRWLRCDIKTTAMMGNVLALLATNRAGGFEGIQVRDGLVTEGISTNLFAVFDGVVQTAPEGTALLSGVTRHLVAELARAHPGLREESVSATDLVQADEVFLTSTTKEVVSVVSVDGERIGDGRPGPVAADLHTRLRQQIAEACGLASVGARA